LAELRGRAVLVLAAGTPHCEGPGVHALPQLLEARLRLLQVTLDGRAARSTRAAHAAPALHAEAAVRAVAGTPRPAALRALNFHMLQAARSDRTELPAFSSTSGRCVKDRNRVVGCDRSGYPTGVVCPRIPRRRGRRHSWMTLDACIEVIAPPMPATVPLSGISARRTAAARALT